MKGNIKTLRYQIIIIIISLPVRCRFFIIFQLFVHYRAEWAAGDSCNFSKLTGNSCMLFFSKLFTVNIWQSNFTESASGLRSCWLDHPNWSVFHTPRQRGLATVQYPWPSAGCWRCHLISSLRWQEALIYGTQEPFFFQAPHLVLPRCTDRWTPWLSRKQIRSLRCVLVCQNEISSWWLETSTSVLWANELWIHILNHVQYLFSTTTKTFLSHLNSPYDIHRSSSSFIWFVWQHLHISPTFLC